MTKVSDRLARAPRKIEKRRVAHRRRSKPYRVAWVAAAVIIVAGGVALVVLPGPAFVVIPIGLAMLSLEFGWASRALGSGIGRGADAAEAVQRASPAKKFGIAAVALAVAAAMAALAVALL